MLAESLRGKMGQGERIVFTVPEMNLCLSAPGEIACTNPGTGNASRRFEEADAFPGCVKRDRVLRFFMSRYIFFFLCAIRARVAELVDALDLESSGIVHAGSSPASRTSASVRKCTLAEYNGIVCVFL